eukprot:TRINITY_DN917_c0_g1_i1.p1 TRINITY_DN917_c0_g1~~TRINITY_DN917_c0_g1_i1.p1  ORF type:complete len:402 (-),score=68.86 TRINITY_DN917_c0_g1_i1:353-1558(-)
MIHPATGEIPAFMSKYRVGKIESQDVDRTYRFRTKIDKEIRRRVGKELRELSPWANSLFWGKAIFLLLAMVSLEWSWIYTGPTVVKAVILGLVYALIGLNIQHDANHGAISPNHKVNRLMGYTQDLIGGSRMLWIQQHVVGHHPQTNRTEIDPDIMTSSPLMNMCIDRTPEWWHKFQHYYVLPLLHLLAFSWILLGIRDIWTMKFSGKYSINSAVREREVSLLLRIFYLFRIIILPLYLYPSLSTLGCIYLLWGVGSFYLGFFFLLSHNFEGVKTVKENPLESSRAPTRSSKKRGSKQNKDDFEDEDAEGLDWTVTQITTSSTLGGRVLGFLNGGLNYQIEHHLFPRICHVHYPLIAPIVREVCEKYGVKYNYFPSIWSNLSSTLKQVRFLGNLPSKQKSL